MNTIILRTNARKTDEGARFTIEVVGDSAIKDAVRETIRGLEHHPAAASRRNIIDMLSIIEKHRLNIRHTEHYFDDENMEIWLFVLQG